MAGVASVRHRTKIARGRADNGRCHRALRGTKHVIAEARHWERQLRPTMDTVTTIVYLLVLIALFGGVLVWAFGRKRKKRFEEDAKMPFQE
jgi:cytochrome c oxidase cbb3-type subunit 4